MRKLLFLILVLLFSPMMGQDADALFEAGKEHYKADEFEQAIAKWEAILKKGQHSKAVYFNLGNAYYKINQVAPSVYNYEKALQLDPNDREVKNNLAFAQNMRIDVIEPLPKTVFAKAYDNTMGSLTTTSWAWISVILLILGVGSFLGYYFSAGSGRKRLLFVASIVLFGLVLFSFASAYFTNIDANTERMAVVFEEKMQVRDEPKASGTVSFELHAGTKLDIIDQDGDWIRIELANGKDGWVPATTVKEL